MFRVTTIDPANVPRTKEGKVDFGQDFFDRPSYLTVSGQLEGEIYATALGKVYTFGPDVPCGEFQHHATLGRVLDDRAGNGFF